MSKPTKDYVPFSMKIDRRVNDRFRSYANKLGQTYTVCLERIIEEYLDQKGFEMEIDSKNQDHD